MTSSALRLEVSMAEIVNLRRRRKANNRAQKEAQAAENRVRHGRPKAETSAQRREKAHSERKIDGKKLD